MIADFLDKSADIVINLLLRTSKLTQLNLTPENDLKLIIESDDTSDIIYLEPNFKHTTLLSNSDNKYILDMQARNTLRKFNLDRYIISNLQINCNTTVAKITIRYICLNLKSSKLERRHSVIYMSKA